MLTGNPIANLFGRSPFRAMQEHMTVVEECVSLAVPLFEALRNGDDAKVQTSTQEPVHAGRSA